MCGSFIEGRCYALMSLWYFRVRSTALVVCLHFLESVYGIVKALRTLFAKYVIHKLSITSTIEKNNFGKTYRIVV